MNAPTSTAADVVVIGAGVVGSAVAFFAARQGLSVTVVDRAGPASGTSSSGEGNVLISDKELGPELELARYSLGVWRDDLAEFAHLWEFEPKGGVIVASRESSLASLERLVASQREHGITVERLDGDALREAEPEVTPHALGAAYYPDDCQVQPMLVAAHLVRLAREHGARLVTKATVTGLVRRDGRVCGVRTTAGDLGCGAVVNAAGPWAAEIAALAGVRVPVEPRRGFVLVTEPLPPTVRHKVYAAEYVDNVGSSDAGLQASAVVEGTPGGTVLIGSTRERVGFDRTPSADALRTLARNAVALFPFLAEVRALRHYHGFRPYSPDHLPVIGPDPRAPGLWHACGHEGAGVGLSVGTGKLLAQALTGKPTELDLEPFAPQRFGATEGFGTTEDGDA
ncbi:NAD(P)/FAD-dependent oxidoreductase [Saccharomonospora cyanea]|uniref:Glycine/D-amino acid oxidase, deaminating n=1 Tax=Saccharomonospora cyanea NA-134 TaxID=882082 RepID=H5XE49_9PSEU|nr:FAD-binding oxidoreductase [Saccharomonospora cyanea]EHR60295.1 glycine/D-amino acid oxidase, deaminating [Saccharomonospora cyanea NA-134]